MQADGVPGISADRAYRELLAGRTATPVLVVAVIDSGIDSTHEDLKPILWRNPREIAGNGLDDDHNGYADDVRGWNYLGGKNGQNIGVETLEQTRIYRQYRPQFEGKKRKSLAPTDQARFDDYQLAKASYMKDLAADTKQFAELTEAYASNAASFKRVKEKLNVTVFDTALLHQVIRTRTDVPSAASLYAYLRRANAASTDESLDEAITHYRDRLDKSLNMDYDPRPLVVGDNPTDLAETAYGNPDTQGPNASHGTHCAGIITGLRGNGHGADGVAGPTVRIMSATRTWLTPSATPPTTGPRLSA